VTLSNLSSPRALFFHDARELLTLRGLPSPRRGSRLAELGIIAGGAVLTRGLEIIRIGRTSQVMAEARRLRALPVDCRGGVVLPGFVDCHTHLVFAGSRVEDFEQRVRGKTYEEIARQGGGIAFSAKRLRKALPGELVSQAKVFLQQFAAHGTTSLEVKSGYGLDTSNELKILRAVRALARESPLELIPTLMAAHALPASYRSRRRDYLRLITERMIPQVAGEKLAEYIDCFCDRGAFTPAECGKIFAVGRRYGLIPRIHAEQLHHTGGARLAVRCGAASADHLDHVTDREIRALAASRVMAVLLPGANFNLGLKFYPPARRLIEAGAAVALGTDFNPGSSPTLNMQFILSLACTQMGLAPAEAIVAATFNAACALGRAARLGSLEPGKQADFAVMDVRDYREIPYYFAWNHCVMTVKAGRIIYRRA